MRIRRKGRLVATARKSKNISRKRRGPIAKTKRRKQRKGGDSEYTSNRLDDTYQSVKRDPDCNHLPDEICGTFSWCNDSEKREVIQRCNMIKTQNRLLSKQADERYETLMSLKSRLAEANRTGASKKKIYREAESEGLRHWLE